MTTQSEDELDILVTVPEAQLRKIVAEYVTATLDNKFYVHPSSIEFKLEQQYDDRPGGSSRAVFKHATAKASRQKLGGIQS